MPNSGSKRPHEPLPVMVRDEHKASLWGYGLMDEWRWIDEGAGTWEGLVSVDSTVYAWVPGVRLKRIGTPAPRTPN